MFHTLKVNLRQLTGRFRLEIRLSLRRLSWRSGPSQGLRNEVGSRWSSLSALEGGLIHVRCQFSDATDGSFIAVPVGHWLRRGGFGEAGPCQRLYLNERRFCWSGSCTANCFRNSDRFKTAPIAIPNMDHHVISCESENAFRIKIQTGALFTSLCSF